MKKILLIAAVMLLGSSGAWALGTTAGTWIDNNATLTYSAGGVLQPEVNASLNARHAADSFKVDKKVDMVLVTTDSDQIEVTPGQDNMITHFAFTNEGNADQNFTFTVSNLGNGEEADYDTDKDNDNVSDLLIQCTYTAADGTTKTETWANSFTLEIEENGTAECNVSADINDPDNTPNHNDVGAGDDGDIMNIELLATAVQADGSTPETNTSGESADNVDVVLADGITHGTLGKAETGDTGQPGVTDGHKGDTPSDGKEAARSGYIIQTPVLSATKKSCAIWDPINEDGSSAGQETPKRIPGAKVRYVIDITNTGSADVNDLNVSDRLSDYFLTTSNVTATEVKKIEQQADCDFCETLRNGMVNADHEESNKVLTVKKIDVNSTSSINHTCVTFEVEVK